MKALTPALLIAVALGSVSVPMASAASSRPTCNGTPATITGSGTVHGTAKRDVIVVTKPGATILAGKGSDLICAVKPRTVDAGAGNDTILFSGSGTMLGGDGNDTIRQLHAGGADKPQVFGGAGRDVVTLTVGNAFVDGGSGNDRLTAGKGPETLEGGTGDDVLTGAVTGLTTLLGGAGADRLVVRGPGTSADGGAGNDTFVVPPALLASTHLVTGAGDLVNGVAPGSPTPAPVPTPTPSPSPTPPPALIAPPVPTAMPALSVGEAGGLLGARFGCTAGVCYGFVDLAIGVGEGVPLTSWQVDFGDGSAPSSGLGAPPSDLAHVYSATGTFTTRVTVWDAQARSTEASFDVGVGKDATGGVTAAPATQSVAGSDLGPVTMDTSAFTAGEGSHIVSYVVEWQDGADVHGTGTPPATMQHSYPPGIWHPGLRLVDDHGSMRHTEATVEVDGPSPVAVLCGYTFSTIYGYAPGTCGPTLRTTLPEIDFDTRNSTAVGTATVDFGDGSSTTDQTYTGHRYAPGTWTATLTITSPGQTAKVAHLQVVVAALPTVSMSAPAGRVDGSPTVLALTGNAGSPGTSITQTQVSSDDASAPVTYQGLPASVSHVYDQPGLHHVTVDVTTDFPSGGYATEDVVTTGAFPGVSLTGPGRFAARTGTTDVDAGAGDVYLSVAATPSTGTTLLAGVIDFGDGSPRQALTFTAGGGASAAHHYAVGDFDATAAVEDSSGRYTVQRLHISASGDPTLTQQVTGVRDGSVVHLTVSTVSDPGAGASPYRWQLTSYVTSSSGSTSQGPQLVSAGAPGVVHLDVTGAPGSTVHISTDVSTDHLGDAFADTDYVLP